MRPRNARILRELIDVAVRRTEVHPGITAFVLFSKENFNPVGPKLTGGCSDIVNKEACNWTRRGRLMSLSGPKTSTLLPSGNFNTRNPGRSSSDRRPRTSRKKVNCRLEILRASTNPGQLNDFHTVRVRALAQHVN
jgi:hypothetical protein